MGNNSVALSQLMQAGEEAYADFQAGLTPGIDRSLFIGVRVPKIREIAKKLYMDGSYKAFISELPHKYYDENMLHSAILSEIKDKEECIYEIERFLEYIDNWAVCDTLIPKCYKNSHKMKKSAKKKTAPEKTVIADSCENGFPMEQIKKWCADKKVFTCRFGIKCLMSYYLDDYFREEYLEIPASVISDEYYINMMIAWYFATALAKQWDATVKVINEKSLPVWVHNKTIQKAVESYRITDEQKDYLRALRIR